MALSSQNWPTLADLATRYTEDGIDAVIELLSQMNGILDDMPWYECNDGTGHKTTMRTGLPTPAWRQLNQGIQPTKSTTVQQRDTCGMLEAYSEVDKALVQISGDPAEFRLSEATAFLEGMNQNMAQTLFYGNTNVNPERFLGLAPRYSSKSAQSGQNVIDGAGTGTDNTSVWLVGWGPTTCHGVFPKGSTAGLQRKDLGEVTIENVNGVTGTRMQGYREHFRWDCGLSLRDWRYVVRIANIDVSDLIGGTGTNPQLINLMIKAMHRIPNFGRARFAWYMNRTCLEYLDLQRLSKAAGAGLQYKDVDGKNTPVFREVPIRIVDSILNTESTVS